MTCSHVANILGLYYVFDVWSMIACYIRASEGDGVRKGWKSYRHVRAAGLCCSLTLRGAEIQNESMKFNIFNISNFNLRGSERDCHTHSTEGESSCWIFVITDLCWRGCVLLLEDSLHWLLMMTFINQIHYKLYKCLYLRVSGAQKPHPSPFWAVWFFPTVELYSNHGYGRALRSWPPC